MPHHLGRTRHEHDARSGGVIDAGEGSHAFHLDLGIWIGVLFLVAIAFNTISVFWDRAMRRLISSIGCARPDATSVPFALRLAAAGRRGVVGLRRKAPCVGICALLALGSCDESGVGPRFADIGNPEQGALYIKQIGCGSCHVIPGIDGARGLVGPPLDYMGKRIFIAGLLRNTPANMMPWLRDPQEVVPGNPMPDMDLSEKQARDITAYLYTLD